MASRRMLVGLMMGAVGVVLATAAVAGETTPAVRVAGQLAKIDGKMLTITPTGAGARAVTITCNDATKVSRDANGGPVPATFADLQVGQSVRAYYNQADNVAANVFIQRPGGTGTTTTPPGSSVPIERVAGQLTKIDGKTLTITPTDAGAQATVITCNDATKISRQGDGGIVPAAFGDLQVGQSVRAYYTKADNVATGVIIAKAAVSGAGK